MVTLKKSLHLLAALLFATIPAVSMANTNVDQQENTVQTEQTAVAVETTEHVENHGEENATKTKKQVVQEFIDHHLLDDHFYSFYADQDQHRHYGFALPIVLIDNGLKIFMSTEGFVYNSEVLEHDGQHYKYYHGKIYKTAADGEILYDEHHHPTNEMPLDFSITKNVVGLFLAAILLFLGFTALAKTYKNGPNALPKGFARALEPLVIYVRDEMAKPNIGPKYKQFMPYLLSVFFIIFLLNLLGLTPLGLNVTGNISVTVCLALFTFLYTNLKGNKDYWKHIFWMPGVPVPMKIVLAPIEVLGMFTKPFSLLIRLFANITAGHAVVMGLVAVAFVMQETLSTPGAVGVSFLLTLFLTMLELLIAFLQAFIFTMLSSLFIGSAVQEHDHH